MYGLNFILGPLVVYLRDIKTEDMHIMCASLRKKKKMKGISASKQTLFYN